jgi:S1-C subfamily serine protease
VRIGDEPVTDINSYMDALKKHEPGDEVDVVVKRDGRELSLKIKLESRGRARPTENG